MLVYANKSKQQNFMSRPRVMYVGSRAPGGLWLSYPPWAVAVVASKTA